MKKQIYFFATALFTVLCNGLFAQWTLTGSVVGLTNTANAVSVTGGTPGGSTYKFQVTGSGNYSRFEGTAMVGTTTNTERFNVGGNIRLAGDNLGILQGSAGGTYILGYVNSNNNAYIATGVGSLNGTGTDNTVGGRRGGNALGTGSSNTSYGSRCLESTNSGSENTAVGYQAMRTNTDGAYNTALGTNTLFAANGAGVTGNTAVGYSAGVNYGTYTDCTFLGNSADATATGYTNAMALGNGAQVTASNRVRVGNGAIGQIGGQVAWSTLSDARFKRNVEENVPGLAFIKLLKPVTYNVDRIAFSKHVGEDQTKVDIAAMEKAFQIKETGFLAQDIEKAAKSIGYEFDGVSAPANEKDAYALRYSTFVVPIVKAIQEQQIIIEEKDRIIAELASKLDLLEVRLARLEGQKSGDVNPSTSLKIFPNPTSKSATVKMTISEATKEAKVMVYDMSGKLIDQVKIDQRGEVKVPIEMGNQPAGNYIISLIIDNNMVNSQQFSKQ